VSEIKEIGKLKECQELKEISAEGNPIERERNLEIYRNEVKLLLPQVLLLDGRPLLLSKPPPQLLIIN